MTGRVSASDPKGRWFAPPAGSPDTRKFYQNSSDSKRQKSVYYAPWRLTGRQKRAGHHRKTAKTIVEKPYKNCFGYQNVEKCLNGKSKKGALAVIYNEMCVNE